MLVGQKLASATSNKETILKALLKTRPAPSFTLEEAPTPQPAAGELLVRVRAAAICGSDLNFYLWNEWAQDHIPHFPFICGHEGAGEVAALGDQVSGFSLGDVVAFETHLPCRRCYQCTHGQPHICQKMGLFGHFSNGCFAEYAVSRADATWKLRRRLSWPQAALLEPLGVAARPAFVGGHEGDTVAVIGCGPIGLLAIAAFKGLGAGAVFAIEKHGFRQALARELGADPVLDSGAGDLVACLLDLTSGDGVGTVVDASGSAAAVAQGFKYLRKGGRFFLLGNVKEPLVIQAIPDIVVKEARVRGFHGRELWSTWERAEELAASGAIPFDRLITHRLPLERFEEGFQAALSGQAGKVVFEL